MGVQDIVGKNVPHLGKGIISLSSPITRMKMMAKFKLPTEGGNTTLQSSPSDDHGVININGELRQVGVSNGPEYYNPNPWARILGRANETEIEIDGKISKALIDNGAMIPMMSKGYCDEPGYEIQPLDRLVPPGMYDEVKMHIQEMVDVGAIQPSNSPWASAVVLVQKKDGILRFWTDLRKLNARIIKDTHSLP